MSPCRPYGWRKGLRSAGKGHLGMGKTALFHPLSAAACQHSAPSPSCSPQTRGDGCTPEAPPQARGGHRRFSGGPDPLRRPLDSSTTFTRAPHHRGRPFAKHPAGRPEAPRGASRTRAGAPIAVKTTELRQKQRRSKGQAPRHDEGDPGLLSPPPLLGSSPGRSHK